MSVIVVVACGCDSQYHNHKLRPLLLPQAATTGSGIDRGLGLW